MLLLAAFARVGVLFLFVVVAFTVGAPPGARGGSTDCCLVAGRLLLLLFPVVPPVVFRRLVFVAVALPVVVVGGGLVAVDTPTAVALLVNGAGLAPARLKLVHVVDNTML